MCILQQPEFIQQVLLEYLQFFQGCGALMHFYMALDSLQNITELSLVKA